MEFLGGLHPLVIHFPIVLLLCYAVLEISGILFNREEILKAAFIVLIAGVISCTFAVLTGNQAEVLAEKTIASEFIFPEEIVHEHEWYATITVWYFVIILILCTYFVIKKKFVGRIRYIFIIFAVVGTILIYNTAEEGDELVYKYGIGTEIIKSPENK